MTRGAGVRSLDRNRPKEISIPKVSRESAAEHADHGPVEQWSEDVDGYNVTFVRFAVDIDSTPCSRGFRTIAVPARTGATSSRAK
jgi:hypothetical protein